MSAFKKAPVLLLCGPTNGITVIYYDDVLLKTLSPATVALGTELKRKNVEGPQTFSP